jgi:hypothetical protein
VQLALKIIVPLLAYAVVWLQAYLDYRKGWRDRRTRLHRLGFQLLTWLVVPGAVLLTVVLVVNEDRATKRAEGQLTAITSTLDQVASLVGANSQEEVTQAIRELKTQVAVQEKQLAATSRTAMAVHQQLLPRTLTAEQVSELRAALSNARVKARIPVIATDSQDSRHLASQLVRALLLAGWDTEAQAGVASPPWEGIVLTVEDVERVPSQASLLATQLERLGLTVRITGRQGAPRVQSLSGSKSLAPAKPRLELLNLWVGEKAALRNVP